MTVALQRGFTLAEFRYCVKVDGARCRMQEIKKGDIFRLFEPEGAQVPVKGDGEYILAKEDAHMRTGYSPCWQVVATPCTKNGAEIEVPKEADGNDN